MSALAFLDTSILLCTDDASAPKKRSRAISLVAEHRRQNTLVISLQVLQEYYAAAVRKLGVDPAIAHRKVELLARARVVRFEQKDVISAIELHRLSQISFWDAMIVHAARLAGVAVLYSEELSHGSLLAGVQVVNPFLPA